MSIDLVECIPGRNHQNSPRSLCVILKSFICYYLVKNIYHSPYQVRLDDIWVILLQSVIHLKINDEYMMLQF